MRNKNKTSLLKKVTKTLPVFFGGVALVYAVLIIKDIDVPTVLPVNQVQVIGELNFLDKKIIEVIVNANIDGGYFTVDLNKIREALMQQPWIKSVSLRRRWPTKLDVVIAEQVPVAYWNHDGYINKDGEVFKPEKIDESLNLLKLNGPDGREETVWKFMNELYKEIALLDFDVVRLDLDDRRSWQLVIAENNADATSSEEIPKSKANTIDVKLGRFDTEKRLKRFVQILPSLTVEQASDSNDLTGKKIKVIDMRYPNGFAVQMATENTAVVKITAAKSRGA